MTGHRLRRVLAAAALGTALLLGGCWDRVEVNDLEVINGAAFDAAPGGGVRVTIAVVLPQNLPSPGGGGGNGPSAAVLSATGGTIGDAVASLSEMLPGRLFWGDTRIIVVGEPLAAQGVQPVVDFFLRAQSARLRTNLLVTPGDAAAVLRLGSPLRVPPTDAIYERLRQRLDPVAYVYEIAEAGLTAADALLVPVVRTESPQGGSGGNGDPSQTVTPATFRVAGAAILYRGRLVGWLDQRQTRGALWLLGRARPNEVRVQGPDGSEVTVRVDSVKIARRAVRLSTGEPAIEVQVDAGAAVEQVDRGTPPLDDPAYLRALGEALQRTIRDAAALPLAVMRQDGIDFLGFGRLIAAYQPTAWRHIYGLWPRDVRHVPVALRVRAHVRNTGNLTWLP